MNNHEIACLLAELFGDNCACNYNGIDEWLPNYCELLDVCPNPVGVACWEQYLKHKNIKGCSYLDESCKIQYCKYYDGMSCKHENRAIFASTLLGAHPADCPLLNEVENDEG